MSGVDNGIVRNWFHSNIGLSIDLDANGVTDNDLFDVDTGPNRLQNYMEIESVHRSGASVSIEATLLDNSSGHFRADFYATRTCDSSGHGEGEIFLGGRRVDADLDEHLGFSLTSQVPVPDSYSITGTVSVLGGPFPADTSEFSECIAL